MFQKKRNYKNVAFLCLFQLQRILSHYMSTGICHCLNVTAQLVSSGWPARAPHLSPVAAGAAVSMDSEFFASGAVFQKLHGLWAGSRKVRLSLPSLQASELIFTDHFSGDIHILLPRSSIILESPVMTPDIQWSDDFENSWVPYKVKVRIQNMAKNL